MNQPTGKKFLGISRAQWIRVVVIVGNRVFGYPCFGYIESPTNISRIYPSFPGQCKEPPLADNKPYLAQFNIKDLFLINIFILKGN